MAPAGVLVKDRSAGPKEVLPSLRSWCSYRAVPGLVVVPLRSGVRATSYSCSTVTVLLVSVPLVFVTGLCAVWLTVTEPGRALSGVFTTASSLISSPGWMVPVFVMGPAASSFGSSTPSPSRSL